MICYMNKKDKTNRNQLVIIKFFKLTNKNAAKRLKMKQKMRKIIKTGKIAKTTLKQIVIQQF